MKRKTIAVLFDYLEGDYQSALRASIEAAAQEHDVNLLIVVGRPLNAPDPSDAAQNEIYQRLRGAHIDGVILAAASLSTHAGAAALADFCHGLRQPCCSVSMQIPGVPSLVVNNRQGTGAVVDHLIEAHGRRRIGYIRGPLASAEANQRYDAYVASLAAHGLSVNPALVEVADFWTTQGHTAMQRLLARGEPLDAVVAANDHMAFGAIDALRAAGVRIPRDVLVAGFDDVPSALVAHPSLTTARQPLAWLGRTAVESLLLQIEGKAVPLLREADVELVKRQSCGCSYRFDRAAASRRASLRASSGATDFALDDRELCALMSRCLDLPPRASESWVDPLLGALRSELAGESGCFLQQLEDLLARASSHGDLTEKFDDVIDVLRDDCRRRGHDATTPGLEDLWHASTRLVGAATSRRHALERLDIEHAHEQLRRAVERVSTALGHAALARALEQVLPETGVRRAAISLYDPVERGCLRPLSVVGEGTHGGAPSEPFASAELAPRGFFTEGQRWSHMVMPLTFGAEQLGLAVLEAGCHISIYSMLREQIGSAVKAASLHREVVREAAARERAERDELRKETEIARQIQVAILPVITSVEGLELAGLMLPAADIGGDYYDILPTRDGCWLGIGDVAGHGLLAGLIMLMIQSMVAGMVSSGTPYTPSALLNGVNVALWDNVRHRLGKDNHATLALIQYRRSGTLVFSGCHEELLICRARTGRCERIPTQGVWTCAIEDVSDINTDSEITLEDGDLLVLYTDGITEAMNLQHEQFGLNRLCALVELNQELSVSAICRAVADAATRWSSIQMDDISVLVGRYSALTPTA